MENIGKILNLIGLSEIEAKLYLTILELGKSGISSISKKSEIKRTTIYPHILSLLKKDVIKRTIKGKRTFYIAQDPKSFVNILDEKKKNFLEKLPILESLYSKNSPNPSLEFYEDKEDLRNLYKKIWGSGMTIYTFISPLEFYKHFSEEFDRSLGFLEKKAGGKTKTLTKNYSFSKEYIKNNPFSQIKLLPKDFELDVDIIVLGNSIIMISFSPIYAIVIKNKTLADFHRNLHNYFWNILK
ncbi:MAG: helix-turn-helix domain-containing protein [Candidatus Gracilibacteria bacterium]|nr:helix-turn-helix domain-containing protein [Candidatus Gracilibacteria bacterium]